MDMDSFIGIARREYYASGVRLALPQRPYTPSASTVARPSALGGCLLQLAYEKTGTAPQLPALTPEQDSGKAWLMDHGNYVAQMVQEPLMYYAMTHPNVTFKPEVPINNLGMAGAIDGILSVAGETYILEIKDTEGMMKRSVGEPRKSHALQVIAYMMMTGISLGYIVTCSKWNFHSYEVREVNPKQYMVFDNRGKQYAPAKWMPNWNTPGELNQQAVLDAVSKYQHFVERIQDGGTPPPPIQPLNEDNSFYCFWHHTKPTKTTGKLGEGEPNCPFARGCHGLENRTYKTKNKEGGGYEFA